MSKLIPPTPGRVVWYWPSQQEIDAKAFVYEDPTQPLAATVARVWHDRMVNLSVVDQAGAQFRRTSVRLLQEDDERPHTSEGPFACWMPYQLAQQEKAAESAGKFVDVGEYQGKVPEGVSVGDLAAAQGFTGESVAQQGEKLQASAPTLAEYVEAQKQLDAAAAAGAALGQSPIQQIADDAKQLADAVAGLPPEAGAVPSKDEAAQA